jgi:hypothetical protein
MNKVVAGALLVVAFAAMAAGGGKAEAATVWPGHYETPYVMSDPALFASVDIAPLGSFFLVRLNDAIPPVAWNNPDCHGPARATGIGRPFGGTQMAVFFFWNCADGTTRFSVRYFRFNDHGDVNLSNDEIVFCSGPSFSTCGQVFQRSLPD